MLTIQLYKNPKIEDLQTNTIVRASSEINYTIFYLTNGKKITIARTLGNFEPVLVETNNFIRPNKSHIINQSFIKSIFWGEQTGTITLLDGTLIPISRRRLQAIKERISK